MQSEEYFSTITGDYLFADMNLWSGFTDADRAAVRTLYPAADQDLQCTCTPEASGNPKRILKPHINYHFTATFSNSACPEPAYEISITKQDAGPGTFKRTDTGNGKVSVEFEPGVYKVRAVVKNMTGTPSTEETYYVTTDKLWVKGPEKIEIGKTYDFYVTYDDPSKPSPEYSVIVKDLYFPNTYIPCTKVGSGHYQIRFPEYGSYEIDFGITGSSVPVQTFRFTQLYRPYNNFYRYQIGPSGSSDPLAQKLCGKFTCGFTFQENEYQGNTFTVFPHRFVAELRLRVAKNKIHTAPMHIDHIITTEEMQIVALDAGAQVASIPVEPIESKLAPDSENTETCYTILEPFYDLVFPVDDYCGFK